MAISRLDAFARADAPLNAGQAGPVQGIEIGQGLDVPFANQIARA
jgi:hypothetical protein